MQKPQLLRNSFLHSKEPNWASSYSGNGLLSKEFCAASDVKKAWLLPNRLTVMLCSKQFKEVGLFEYKLYSKKKLKRYLNSKVNLTFQLCLASRFDAKYYSYFAACQYCQNIPLSNDHFYDLFLVKLMAHFK